MALVTRSCPACQATYQLEDGMQALEVPMVGGIMEIHEVPPAPEGRPVRGYPGDRMVHVCPTPEAE